MGPTRICRRPRAGRRGHPKPRESFIRNVTFASLVVLGLFLAACAARTVSTVPKDNEDTVVVPLEWKAGEVFHYEVTTSAPPQPEFPSLKAPEIQFTLTGPFKPSSPYRPSPAAKSAGPAKEDVTIKILKADASGYLVGWRYGFAVSKDAALDLVRRAIAAEGQTGGAKSDLDFDPVKAVGFDFSFDGAGNWQGIENWQEIGDVLKLMYRAVAEEMKDAPPDDTKGLENAIAMGLNLANSREAISDFYGKDAAPLFSFFGKTLPVSKPLESESRLENPLTGEPTSCRIRTEVRSVNKAARRAVIAWTKTLDPAQFRKLMEKFAAEFLGETFEKLAGDETGKMLKDTFSTMSIEEHGELEIDLVTGWPDRSTRTTIVEMRILGEKERTETTTSIERIPSERRQKGA